jgi:hypothetical protein
MKTYDPFDWYWLVAGSAVFSSKAADYVPANNAAYIEWKSDGTAPTAIATEAELGDVLAPYNIRPAPAQILDGYQDSQARKLTIEVVAKVLFNVVNEIRVLKGQAPVTAQQFRNYVKGLM